MRVRRLVDRCRNSRTGPTTCPNDCQCAPVSRLDHQQRQVRSNTQSGLPFHRYAVQYLTVHSGAPAEDASESPVCSPTLDDQPHHHSPGSTQIAGHGGVYGNTGSMWKTPPTSSPVVGRHSLVSEDREPVRQDHSSSVGTVRGGLVGITSSPAGSFPRHQGNGSHSLHGCVQLGLGSPVRLTLDTGTVVSTSKIVSNQRSGDAGRHQCRDCERLPSSSEVPSGALDVRQHSDSGLHQERGRHLILHSHAADVVPAEVVRSQGDNTGSRPSARSPQHPGRFAVQSWPDTEHRVDDGLGASLTSICPVGRTTGWLVCDVRQQTTHQVCIAESGPQGGVHGRHVGSLGQWEGSPVRFFTIQDGPSSPAEGRLVSRCSDDSDRSAAGNSFLVPGTSGSVPRRSHPAVRRRSTTADSGRCSFRQGDRDSSLPAVKSSHVETLQAILVAKGHSREAAHMMSRALQESSLHVYESHWVRFVSFCRSKSWHVFRVRSHHFSTYMMHLFRDGLLPSTIISHRTSVASVLRHWVYDRTADPHIKLLIRAFRLECLVQRRIMPKWDFHLVFLALMRPRFASECDDQGETSDDVIPLKWRTMKTVFLLALTLSVAPGRCVFLRGNTQRQLMVSLAGARVSCQEPATVAGSTMDLCTGYSTSHLVRNGKDALPCQAIEAISTALRTNRGGRQRLFIHWNRTIRDIMRSHISRWIVETVKEAYTRADREYGRITAHEVRALSTSWAYNCQVVLPDILSAVFWRSSGVF